jgi:endonuclease/exonuclease/phosphatase family metal-dependent hydrolase
MTGVGARVLRVGLWISACALALWAVARQLGVDRGYLTIALFAVTPYAAPASLALALLCLVAKARGPAIVAGIACLLLVVTLAPREIAGPSVDNAGGEHVRVLTVNFEHGAGDGQQLADLIADLDVDVLAVEQLTPDGEHDLREAGVQRMLPRQSTWGPHIRLLTALPMTRRPVAARRFPGATLALPGGDRITVWTVHATDPTSSTKANAWRGDLEAVPRAASSGPQRVVLGDFNATLDHVQLRRVIDSGYVDAADSAGAGLAPTFPAHAWWPPPITIDHVLVDEGIEVADVKTVSLTHADHRGVFADLILPPA